MTILTTPVAAPDGAIEPAAALAGTDLLPDASIHFTRAMFIPRPREVVYQALLQVRMTDLPLLRLLMAIRTLSGSERGSTGPMFAGLRKSGVVYVEDVAGQAVIVAGAGRFWTRRAFEAMPDRPAFLAFDRPDCARMLWVLWLADAPGGTFLLADLRVKPPTEARAARTFRWYWRLMGWVGATVSQHGIVAAVKHRALQQRSAGS